MKVDESGALWPYPRIEEEEDDDGTPTWKCPGGFCDCESHQGSAERIDHRILFFDENAERMMGARCRILEDGRLANKHAPFADGGVVAVKIRKSTRVLDIEWAPSECPETIGFPFRKRYHVDLGADGDESLGRRLHNLGFPPEPAMEDGIRSFQQTYLQSPTGAVADVQAQLVADHDDGALPPVPPPELRGTIQLANFAPSSPAANQLVGSPQSSLTPSAGPPAPGGTQPLGVVRPNASVIGDIVIDWGTRFRTIPKESTVQSSSFWLNVQAPAPFPVALGVVPAVGGWDTGPATPLPLAPETKASKTSVKAPAAGMEGASFVRLDVDITATIGTVTRTVLAFKQLYTVDGDGRLKAALWSFEDYSLQQPSSGGPPARAPGTSTVARGGRREGTGLHPLLRHEEQVVPAGRRKTFDLDLRIARIFINAEFVDATELWWAIHPQEMPHFALNPIGVPQYLNPALGARCEHLRVLAWTGGGLPMIWFAVIPDATVSNLDDGSADIVFFRPPPQANSFEYTPNAAGFAHSEHKSTTMSMLARYLLSPQPLTTLVNAGISDITTLRQYADQIAPGRPKANSIDPTVPPEPMDVATSFPTCFRPVGLERSLNNAPESNILLLPLANRQLGFPAAIGKALKDLVASAVRVLWNSCAVARETTAGPGVATRQLWLAAHSAGNLAMWSCLQSNQKDIDRILSFSATPRHGNATKKIPPNLAAGIPVIRSAAAERKKLGKVLDAFVIAAPDMTHSYDPGDGSPRVQGIGIDSETDRQLRRTRASITLIPDFDKQRDYYTLLPVASMNPFLRHVLGNWTDAEIEASARTDPASKWDFLFFHEYGMYGGFAESGRFIKVFRSFLLEALGAPNPRPPL
jgi:hypothetical protein